MVEITGESKIYITKSGDTWDMLAIAAYSEEKLASVLINANRKYAGTLIFPAGVALTIPIVKEYAETPATAAPWRD